MRGSGARGSLSFSAISATAFAFCAYSRIGLAAMALGFASAANRSASEPMVTS